MHQPKRQGSSRHGDGAKEVVVVSESESAMRDIAVNVINAYSGSCDSCGQMSDEMAEACAQIVQDERQALMTRQRARMTGAEAGAQT